MKSAWLVAVVVVAIGMTGCMSLSDLPIQVKDVHRVPAGDAVNLVAGAKGATAMKVEVDLKDLDIPLNLQDKTQGIPFTGEMYLVFGAAWSTNSSK